jgi:hypothetical protein
VLQDARTTVLTVLTGAGLLGRQLGGQSAQQPGGQLRSKQQSPACGALRVSGHLAHALLATASASSAANPSVIHVRLVITLSLLAKRNPAALK